MTNPSGKCAVVGVGETAVGKRPETSTNSLHLEAIKACLDEAVLGPFLLAKTPVLIGIISFHDTGDVLGN